MEIIGRKRERSILTRCEQSAKPEFVAVYGRRRVGKTFLITEHFHNKFAFTVTGISGGNRTNQLGEFRRALMKSYRGDVPVLKSWFEAFAILEDKIEGDTTLGKKVIFIDELPWFDTHKSGFVPALEHFWNSYAARNPDILLIVCGSAASWMINNTIDNYGGLYNRITESMIIKPFNLGTYEEYLSAKGISFSRQQLAEAYMILGGIPYYADLMDKSYGLNQNIDLLFFAENAKLSNEYGRLYSSLFRNADNHMRVVEALAKRAVGLTRREISETSGISDGGGLTKVLIELESSGFISRHCDIFHKKDGDYFKLVDFFTLFYHRYLRNRKSTDRGFWTNYLAEPGHRAWCGYAFERLCMLHIDQIKQRLGISGVISEVYTFRSKLKKGGAQIDIVIDRRDSTINLCECKFSGAAYTITSEDAASLENKRDVFLQETKTKKSIHMTMIAANGLTHNAYCNDIQAVITLDDLFLP